MRTAAVVALAAAVFLGPAGARGEEGTKPPAPAARPTRADLDAAVARGTRFLLGDQKPDGEWITREYGLDSSGHTVAVTAVEIGRAHVRTPVTVKSRMPSSA